MPAQVLSSVENNFTKGLITEATGLNFPENACTSCSNTEFTLIGDVIRREGINFELNGTTLFTPVSGFAQSTYVWNNPGGDGNSKLLVKQIGQTLYFYNIATSTVAAPLSTQLLAGKITLLVGTGSTFDSTKECQYADGNGYLFVYHPSCDTNYVTYNPSTLAVVNNVITVQQRDFIGVIDNLTVNTRPSSLSNDHQYNLQNQGWTSSNPWSAQDNTQSFTSPLPGGINNFNVASGLSITNGQVVIIYVYIPFGGGNNILVSSASGTVTNYSTTHLAINITSSSAVYPGTNGTLAVIVPISTGYLSTWNSAEGNFPSNADVWWYFKDSSGAFNPATTANNVTLATGNAPQGHYILNAFNQDRATISGLSSITTVTTTTRPSTGCWFQGRVWYTGVNAQQPAAGDEAFFTWAENIYFSQVVSTASDFGLCFQTNDPSSENLNDLLPTDGGVITIVGSGTIHKLFPISNGLLVFANNGVWFVTGSQGIGFTANDYTITKISSVKILSNKSFVDVLGLPYFWNEEGIYQVITQQNGSLAVEPLTVGTILTFYNTIPLASKKYARGDYDPINYVIQWVYKSELEASVTDRYQFDSILNYNVYNKAFFPYSISAGNKTQFIHGINYINYPFISSATPEPDFKYHCSSALINNGFAEEFDTAYVDWGSANYKSTFTTGYKLHGGAVYKTQIPYVYTYSRNSGYAAFYIQGLWDYAVNFDSNRWSQPQFIEINEANTAMAVRRHKIRGRGLAVQLQFTSVDGEPFDIMGWAVYEVKNTGV